MKLRTTVTVLVGAALLGGCAASLQSTDDLQSATAMSLGLQPADVTISNRQDSGVATNYWARTAGGRQYSCVRTAGVSMFGVTKSSPLCNQTNAAVGAAPQPSNALLDAHRQQLKK